MTNRIHLGAIVEREGRILLIRQTPRSPWELPGGELQPRQTDADEAMAEALDTFGITISEPEERFLETLYLPDGDGQIIYNLYGATDWTGEPEIPIGMGAGWYTFDELEAVSMQDEVRTAILVAYGMKDAPSTDAQVLQAMSAASNPDAIQPPLGTIPPFASLPVDAPVSAGPAEVAAAAVEIAPPEVEPVANAVQSPFARPTSFEPANAGPDDDESDDPEELATVAEALDIPEATSDAFDDVDEDDELPGADEPVSTLAQVADSISQEPLFSVPPQEPMVGALPAAAPPHAAPPTRSTRRERGLDVLGTLGNTTDVAGRLAGLRRSYPELADDVVDFAMGDVWSGAALTRRERSLLVVAMLSAMGGRPGPLASHLNGALNHGATPDELVETLRMVAVYAGFPAALEAWKLMETTFTNRDEYPSGRAE